MTKTQTVFRVGLRRGRQAGPMSDISRIETDAQNFRSEANASPRANPVHRARGVGLAISALMAVLVAALLL